MDSNRPTLAAQLATLKKEQDKPAARRNRTGSGSGSGASRRGRGRNTGRPTNGRLAPVDGNSNGTSARGGRGRGARGTSESKRNGSEGKRDRGTGRSSSRTSGAESKQSNTSGRSGGRRGGRSGGRSGSTKPKIGPRQRAELLVKELEKLVEWNAEVGYPKDHATHVLESAADLVHEMELCRDRVDKGVSYNPAYAEKQFLKIIKPCRLLLREARDALAARAFIMTKRARNKLASLKAHNEAEGNPDDEATSLIAAADAAVAEAEEWRTKKEAAADNDDEVIDAFIKAAHDAKLAVDAVGFAMRRRMSEELDEADELLHNAEEQAHSLHERNIAAGEPPSQATDDVNDAVRLVAEARHAHDEMELNPDTLELATEYLSAAHRASDATNKAAASLLSREKSDIANAKAMREFLKELMEHLQVVQRRHSSYRNSYAPSFHSPAKGRRQRQEREEVEGDAEHSAAQHAVEPAAAAIASMDRCYDILQTSPDETMKFMSSVREAALKVFTYRALLRTAVTFDVTAAKESFHSTMEPDFKKLQARAEAMKSAGGDSSAAWAEEYKTASAQHESLLSIESQLSAEAGELDPEAETKAMLQEEKMQYCDLTFKFVDELLAWTEHIAAAESKLSRAGAAQAKNQRARLVALSTELRQAREVAMALGLEESSETWQQLISAEEVLQTTQAMEKQLAAGKVTPADSARFAQQVEACFDEAVTVIRTIKSLQMEYFTTWTTTITTITEEVTTITETIEFTEDTDPANAALMKAGAAVKKAERAMEVLSEDVESTAKAAGGSASGGSALLPPAHLRKLREATAIAVERRDEAVSKLKAREEVVVRKSSATFDRVRAKAKALKERHARWEAAHGRVVTNHVADDKGVGKAKLPTLSAQVLEMKQLLHTFETVYTNEDSSLKQVLEAGEAFRRAVATAQAEQTAAEAAFEERDRSTSEDCQRIHSTVHTTVEYLVSREKATSSYVRGGVLSIREDPDTPKVDEPAEAIARRDAEVDRDSEVVSTALKRVTELETTIHTYTTYTTTTTTTTEVIEGKEAQPTELVLAAAAAADNAEDALEAAVQAMKARTQLLIDVDQKNLRTARRHWQLLVERSSMTSKADEVPDESDEAVLAMRKAQASLEASEGALQELQAAQEAGNEEKVADALDALNDAMQPLPHDLDEFAHQLLEREMALYSSTSNQLTKLKERVAHLKHRDEVAGGGSSDAASEAIQRAEEQVQQVERAKARVDGFNRDTAPKRWREALVAYAELVGSTRVSVDEATAKADKRDASSIQGAQKVLESVRARVEQAQLRNKVAAYPDDDGTSGGKEAEAAVAECERLAREVQAAKDAGDGERETELAKAYMAAVQHAAEVAARAEAGVAAREEGWLVEAMAELGTINTKLHQWHNRNVEDKEPEDDATRCLGEAQELYKAADGIRDAMRKSGHTPEQLDGLRQAMAELHSKAEETGKAFDARSAAQLEGVTATLAALRASLAKLKAENDAAGCPDDTASSELDAAGGDEQSVDKLLDELNAAEAEVAVDLQPSFVAGVERLKRSVARAEAAMAKRRASAQRNTREQYARTTKRLQCLQARNQAMHEPDDEATATLDQVARSAAALQEMVQLGAVGGEDDQGGAGGFAASVASLREAVDGAVIPLAMREESLLEANEEHVVAMSAELEQLRVRNGADGSPDPAVSQAVSKCTASLQEYRAWRKQLGMTAVHPSLRRGVHRVAVKDSGEGKVAVGEEESWVEGAKEVMEVSSRVKELRAQYSEAAAAMAAAEQAEAARGADVESAAKLLASLRDLLAELDERNTAEGSPDDEAGQALKEAEVLVVAANTTKQLLDASPNTKVIRDKFLTSVPRAEEALMKAQELLASRERQQVEVAVSRVQQQASSGDDKLRGLRRQVKDDTDTAAEAKLDTPDFQHLVEEADEAIAAASAAQDKLAAAGRKLAEALASGDAEAIRAAQAELAEAEAEYNAAFARAEKASAAVRKALDSQQSANNQSTIDDTGNVLAQTERELAALVDQNRRDDEPEDAATDAIKAAQVSLLASQSARAALMADPTNADLLEAYMNAVSDSTSLVAAATSAMRDRRQLAAHKIGKARALLKSYAETLSALKQANREAGIPVDDATAAIDHASGKLVESYTLERLLEHKREASTGVAKQYLDSVRQTGEAVDEASKAMGARAIKLHGEGSTVEVTMKALRRLQATELMYQKTYNTFKSSKVLLQLPVMIQVMNVATEDITPARHLRSYVFAACAGSATHDAASKIQAVTRGRKTRKEMEEQKRDEDLVKELQAFMQHSQEDEELLAKQTAAAVKLQAVARGNADRSKLAAGQLGVEGVPLLPPAMLLDKPIDESVLDRLTATELRRVPTQTLIQFVDAVSRAETAVSEAFRVVNSQMSSSSALASSAASERERAAAMLAQAKAELATAEKGFAAMQAQAKGSTPSPAQAKQIAAAGVAVKRAQKGVEKAASALEKYDEHVQPTVAEMIALVSATAEAKAVSEVAADAVAALSSGMADEARGAERVAHKDKVLEEALRQLQDARKVLDECNVDLRKLRSAANSGTGANLEGLQAIAGAQKAVEAAQEAYAAAKGDYEAAEEADAADPASTMVFAKARVSASKASILAVEAARFTQNARQHYNLVGDARVRVITSQEADAVTHLEMAKIALEKYERQFKRLGSPSGNPELLHVQDLIIIAKKNLRNAQMTLLGFRRAQAARDAEQLDQEDSKGSDGNDVRSAGEMQELRNGLTMEVARAEGSVDAVGRQLQMLSFTRQHVHGMSGNALLGRGAGHKRKVKAGGGGGAVEQPVFDPLNGALGSKCTANALVDYVPQRGKHTVASREVRALDLGNSGVHEGRFKLTIKTRWQLLASYRAKLYKAGQLHGYLLTQMHARDMMVLPAAIGRKLKSAIINANRALKRADKVVPSRQQRRNMPAPSQKQLLQFEEVVRYALFKVFRFEKELVACFKMLRERNDQRGSKLYRSATWNAKAGQRPQGPRHAASSRQLHSHNGSSQGMSSMGSTVRTQDSGSMPSKPRRPSGKSSGRKHRHRKHRKRRDDDGYSDNGSVYSGYGPPQGMMPQPPGGMMPGYGMPPPGYNNPNYWQQMQMEQQYQAYKAQRNAQDAAMAASYAGSVASGVDPYSSYGPAADPMQAYYGGLHRGQSMYGMAAAGEAMAHPMMAGGAPQHGFRSYGSSYSAAPPPQYMQGGYPPQGYPPQYAGSQYAGSQYAGSQYAGSQYGGPAGPLDGEPGPNDSASNVGPPQTQTREAAPAAGEPTVDVTNSAMFAEARKTPPKRIRPHHSSSTTRSKRKVTPHVGRTTSSREDNEATTLEVLYPGGR